MDGAEAPSELLWKKNVALLLYLARAPKRRCTREQLIGLLWPDKDDAAARQSVREAIRMVRHYVGDERLKTTGDVIQLQDDSVALDTDEFERLVKQRDWAGTVPLINGKFLNGFKISDAAGFEDEHSEMSSCRPCGAPVSERRRQLRLPAEQRRPPPRHAPVW